MMLNDAIRDYVQRGFSLVPFRAIPPEPGETKWKKKPIVKWEDRQRERPTESAILAEFEKNPNALIGCVTGRISGICTLDIDTDEGRKIADELVPDSLDVPTFETMSGGRQMVFQNPEPSIPKADRFLPGLDFRGEGALAILPPSSNGNGGTYRWLDGLSLQEVEPPSMPSALLSAINNNKVHYRGDDDNRDDTPDFFTEGRRDDDLFSIANALVRGNLPEKIIKQTLDIIASNCKPPFPLTEAEEKIRSAMARVERRDRSLASDVREWVLSSNGVFLSSDVDACRHLSSREDRKNVSKILSRLCDEGLIEKYGNKNGQFRRIDNEAEPLDWKNTDTTPLPLRWPFGIEHMVSVYPGNIAVIAGAANAGKTSFILNFIKLNQQHHAVHLFSSEGGKEELNMRISKFGLPQDAWTFSAWEKSGDFADVVKPDAINVIDYLEIHDDFFKIGGMLKAISDRLKTGFCLIALQKNSGRDEGLGGARGLEKPRLYLAMDNGRLKIVKGKSWKNRENNPNGQEITFKLVDGCKFVSVSEWRKGD